MRIFLLFIALLFSQAVPAGPAAAPMLGPVARHTATVWVQGDRPAMVALEVMQEDSAPPAWTTAPASLTGESGYTARFDLSGLAAGSRYRYRLVWDGVRLPPTYRFSTLAGQSSGGFKVYVGSCAHLHDAEVDSGKPWSGDYEIFDRIASEAASDTQPNLMLWLGDNVYLRADDYESPSGMAQRYRKVRTHPALQKLLPALPHYAIWDDHDYGPNDHNQSFVFKQTSLDLFKRYWPNPSAGLPDTPGIFTTFSVADADFFLLDDRGHRDSDRDSSEKKALFGPGQMRWLKNALLASRARFKFIAGGSQFLNDLSRFEGWHNFKEERGAFLAWLQENKVSGVIFLSGDRHHTELLRHERADAYPLYELTCSSLTSGLHPVGPDEAENPARVPNTLVSAHNYCTLAAEGKNNERVLVMRSRDAQGSLLWETRIEAAALR